MSDALDAAGITDGGCRECAAAVWRHRVLILLVTLMEIRALNVMHGDSELQYSAAADGVILGTPHWRAYQNRLLGPVLVALPQFTLGGSYLHWYEAVTAALLLTVNLVGHLSWA
ncbi:MAG: hypothetical protein JO250_00285 [Armatimonadetes bacterium]|nr:hypothetical protein [Armatimonadota bacterium]